MSDDPAAEPAPSAPEDEPPAAVEPASPAPLAIPPGPESPSPPPGPPPGPPKGRFLRLLPGLPMPGGPPPADPAPVDPAPAPAAAPAAEHRPPPPPVALRPRPAPPPRSNVALVVIIGAVGLSLFACVGGSVAVSVVGQGSSPGGRGATTNVVPVGRAAYPSASWSPPTWASGAAGPAAPADEAEELFRRGVALGRGDGLPFDAAEAARCYRAAASRGHARARAYLAWCHETGTGISRSDEAADRAWTEAAMDGDRLAIGRCHERGLGAQHLGSDEAAEWYRAEAVAGEPLAMLLLGQLEEGGGDGSLYDPVAAREWYERGARIGEPACLERLGLLEDDGLAARSHLTRAAALGRPAAWVALARLLEGGRGGPVDEAGAVACLRSGAAASAAAQRELARHLEAGWGAPKDPFEGLRHLRGARTSGDPVALVEEALWLEEGRGSSPVANPHAARRLLSDQLQRRAREELPQVRVALARLAYEGRGGGVLQEQGRGLLERAGEDPFARFARATLALKAPGADTVELLEELNALIGVVPCAEVTWSRATLEDPGAPDEDRARAATLLRAAARRGDGRAARQLQGLLERGALAPAWEGELGHWFAEAELVAPAHGGGELCVEVLHPFDCPPLVRLALERAALAGDPDAMRELADMLRAGRGGPANERVADDWLGRAEALTGGPEAR